MAAAYPSELICWVLPDGRSCEFAIVVADAWQHRRIGRTLMICLMRAAHSRGLQVMEGFVLASNHKMLGLMDALGFTIRPAEGDPTMKHVSRNLTDVTVPARNGDLGGLR